MYVPGTGYILGHLVCYYQYEYEYSYGSPLGLIRGDEHLGGSPDAINTIVSKQTNAPSKRTGTSRCAPRLIRVAVL